MSVLLWVLAGWLVAIALLLAFFHAAFRQQNSLERKRVRGETPPGPMTKER